MKASPNQCFHLTVEIVREIHVEAIAKFGGSVGVRDLTLLESAVAAPQATFGGKSTYSHLADVAAAYLYYLCQNHPFIDGNKRTALGACIVFLRLNGAEPKPDGPEWEELVLVIAAGTIDRNEATARVRKLLIHPMRLLSLLRLGQGFLPKFSGGQPRNSSFNLPTATHQVP
ncbi:Death-on-curing family protein (modular protein) [Verrucomicrobia bacterium]|nr:Death-on-curing family protein (modular protein) [Verrucomicrobiota bacterium]